MMCFRLSLIGLSAICLTSFAFGVDKNSHLGTPEIMSKIHNSMVILLPHSVGYDGFSSKKNKGKISAHIEKLKDLGAELDRSTDKKDDVFKVIAENFASETSQMLETFRSGNHRNTKFIFQNLTANCVSCHTRQAGNTSKSKAPLYENIDMGPLNLIERAELNTSIRKFDLALDQYEKAFSKTEISKLNKLLIEGYLVDYMIIGLKVRDDKKRVMKTLNSVAFDASVPLSLKRVLAKWHGFLKNYSTNKKYDDLDSIFKLYNKGQDLNSHPFDSSSALVSVLVEKHLQRLLQNQDSLSSETVSKAYLLYGMCEISLSRPLQLSKANYFLEKSIKKAPKTSTAREAYSVLEDHIYFEYSGSSGANVPNDLLNKLTNLKEKIF